MAVTMTTGILLYTNNNLPQSIARTCWQELQRAAKGTPITVVSQSPWPEAPNARSLIYPRALLPCTGSIYRQIIYGLERMAEDYVFLAEHDVLYPPEHFTFKTEMQTQIAYNHNVIRLAQEGWFPWREPHPPRISLLSCLSGWRENLLAIFRNRLADIDNGAVFDWVEPDDGVIIYRTVAPVVDVRIGHNYTGNRRPDDGAYSQDNEHWGQAAHWLELLAPPDRKPCEMPRTLVYTCVFGEYDCRFTPPPPEHVNPQCCYLLITDGRNSRLNSMANTGPYTRVTVNPEHDNPRIASREPKMMPEFQSCEWTIYHDDNIIMHSPHMAIPHNLKADIAGYRHKRRKCLYDEAAYIKHIGWLRPDMFPHLDRAIAQLSSFCTPHNLGLCELGIIARRNTRKVMEFGREWWAAYKACGQDNDQIQFPALLHRSGLVYCPLKGNVYENEASTFQCKRHDQ